MKKARNTSSNNYTCLKIDKSRWENISQSQKSCKKVVLPVLLEAKMVFRLFGVERRHYLIYRFEKKR